MDVTKRSDKQGFFRSRAAAWLFLTSALVGIMLACSGEGGTYLPADGGAEPSVGGPCVEESERACGLTLEVNGDSMTCYRGTQVCEGGVWSPCRDGSVTREPLPSLGFDPTKRRVYANPSLSDPVACGNGQGTGGSGSGGGPSTADFANPCDPGCMHFEENPADLNANGGSSAGPPLEFPPVSCANSLCVATNGSIDETCDPCAYKVVQAHPTCKTNWNQQCVFWATTLCGNMVPPTNACDFGLLADGLIDLRNKASTNSTIGSYGNITIEADSKFGSIYALGNVNIQNLAGKDINLNAGGGIFSNGNVTFQSSNTSKINGNIFAKGKVNLSDVDIHGEVWAGATSSNSTDYVIDGQNGAVITGHAYANGTIAPNPPINIPAANRHPNNGFTPVTVSLPPKVGGTVVPILPITCPTGGTSYLDQSSPRTLIPGTYGTVVMQNGNDLTLRGQGTYVFQDLQLQGGNRLVLDLNGQAYSTGWDVRICGKAADPGNPWAQNTIFGNRVRIAGAGMGWPAGLPNDANGVLKDPKYLTLYYAGTMTVNMETDVYWTGVFMAPFAQVRKSTMNNTPGAPLMAPPTAAEITMGTRSAPVNGAIWAKELYLDVGAQTSAIDPNLCKSIPVLDPVIDPAPCPIDSVGRGLKNEPCTSGLDCQVNSHCSRPETGASCKHSKCVVGEGLTAECDDCVKRICAVDPGCCTAGPGKWAQGCVDKVATVCDAVCQEVVCTQDPCNASTQPIPKTCQDNIGADCISKTCDAMPSCCMTAWTSACVNKMMEPAICGSISTQKRLCDLAVYATNTYTNGGATITGLTGTAATLDPDPIFAINNAFIPCSTGATTASHGPGGGDLTASQTEQYGTVHMGVGTTLRFQTSGSYYMRQLILDGNNTIQVGNGASVDLVVCGQIRIGANVRMTGLGTAGGAPVRLRIYSNHAGNDAIWFVESSPAFPTSADENIRYGGLFAPNGQIRFGANIQHHGFAWGREVTFSGPSSLTFSSDAQASCRSYPLDAGPVAGGAVCALQLVPTPVTGAAECVDNAPNYKDPTCAGYDLALGTPCVEGGVTQVPVCNHGSGRFPLTGTTSVTIGYYPENQGQLSLDEPTVDPAGLCQQAGVSIAAGSCVTIPCSTVPTTGRYTLFVDPPKVLSECNNRRLDNWSATDGRECIPFSQPRTVEYEYEAECPEESKALWGSLTWNTTTPGDSRVVFSLKAGDNDAELDAAMYVEAATARRTPEDTQVCVFKDATPCYADVTETLDLGRNQPQLLRLKADLLPGNGSPVLRDWGISYSCVYDE